MSTITHYFKTPLNGIISSNESLLK